MGPQTAVHQTVLKIHLTHQVRDVELRHSATTQTHNYKLHITLNVTLCLLPFRCTWRFAERQNGVCISTAEAVHTLQHAQPVWTHGSEGLGEVRTFNVQRNKNAVKVSLLRLSHANSSDAF